MSTFRLGCGTGVEVGVGGIGVAVGGMGVAVGGMGVAVGGIAVGGCPGTAVTVGWIGAVVAVAVGWLGMIVGGIDVAMGGSAVAVVRPVVDVLVALVATPPGPVVPLLCEKALTNPTENRASSKTSVIPAPNQSMRGHAAVKEVGLTPADPLGVARMVGDSASGVETLAIGWG